MDCADPCLRLRCEGANPRLREIRDALSQLGLPQDELLEHGMPRLVYGVELADNTREYLLGRAARLKYRLPARLGADATRAICRWWLERWCLPRVRRADVIERVGRQTLVHPIRHAARVVLPAVDRDQRRLFAEE